MEADKQLVKYLVKEASRGLWETGRASAGGAHATLLAQQLSALLNHPIRVSILCHAIDRPIPNNHKVIILKNFKILIISLRIPHRFFYVSGKYLFSCSLWSTVSRIEIEYRARSGFLSCFEKIEQHRGSESCISALKEAFARSHPVLS